jgi:hypothetical protein
MKSLILYYTTSPSQVSAAPTDYQKVETLYGFFWIRAEPFNGGVALALDAAKPRERERVLNTIPAEV